MNQKSSQKTDPPAALRQPSRPFFGTRYLALVALLVAAAAFCLYIPAFNLNYSDYDDSIYIRDNVMIHPPDLGQGRWYLDPDKWRKLGRHQRGIVKWAFNPPDRQRMYASNYHPLTWLSHAFDVQLYGYKDHQLFGHHATNAALHAINSVLVLLLAYRLLGWRTRAHPEGLLNGPALYLAATLAGAVFAVHPQHVESVAWIAERKDVLSGLFYLLAIYVHLSYVRRQQSGRRAWPFYLLTLLLLALALLAKPMAVTLPAVLLLLDIYPLQRYREPSWARAVWAGVRRGWAWWVNTAAWRWTTWLIKAAVATVREWARSGGASDQPPPPSVTLATAAGAGAGGTWAAEPSLSTEPSAAASALSTEPGAAAEQSPSGASSAAAPSPSAAPSPRPRRWFRNTNWWGLAGMVLELVPLAAIVYALCLITLEAQTHAMTGPKDHPWDYRIPSAIWAVVFYLRKFFWPDHLAPLYPMFSRDNFTLPTLWHEVFDWEKLSLELRAGHYSLAALSAVVTQTAALFWQKLPQMLSSANYNLAAVLSAVTLAVLGLAALLSAWRRPIFLVALAIFIVMLVPVLGFVQVGLQAAADRYMYLPSIPVLLVTVAALAWLYNRLGRWRRSLAWRSALGAALLAALAALAATSVGQMPIWGGALRLWEACHQRTRLNPECKYHFANALMNNESRFNEAEPLLLELTDYNGHGNYRGTEVQAQLSRLYAKRNEYDKARSYAEYTLSRKEEQFDPRMVLGVCNLQDNRLAEAKADFEKAIKLRPAAPEAYYNLACAQARLGEIAAALKSFDTALAKGYLDDAALQDYRKNLIRTDTDLDNLRDAPHFREVVTKLGIDPGQRPGSAARQVGDGDGDGDGTGRGRSDGTGSGDGSPEECDDPLDPVGLAPLKLWTPSSALSSTKTAKTAKPPAAKSAKTAKSSAAAKVAGASTSAKTAGSSAAAKTPSSSTAAKVAGSSTSAKTVPRKPGR